MPSIAVGLLVRDGRALLAHRRPDRSAYPDCWDLVGGHIEAGETPEEALRRELLGELGVTVLSLVPMATSFPAPAVSELQFRKDVVGGRSPVRQRGVTRRWVTPTRGA